MASKAIGNGLLHVAKRGYAAPLAAPAGQAQVTSNVLPNSLFVAGIDNGSPVTRVTVAFKAGPRYEPSGELGTAHLLRVAAGLTTSQMSTFLIHRKLGQLGAAFTCSGDREFIYYTLETTRAKLDEASEVLSKLISCPEFRPWELSDITPRLSYDIASLPPQVRVMDLLHKAAYRRGLGNSLYISPKRIGKISSESLQHFAQATQTFSRAAVTVVGSDVETAQMFAQSLQLGSGGEQAQGDPTKYCGGELRKETGGEMTHVALALQGAPAGSNESIALAVAAKALGNGPVTKWGADNTVLGRAIGNIGPFAAAGFNVSYSDSGLYGAVVSLPKDEAAAATKAIAKTLKNPAFKADTIAAAKNLLKLSVLTEAENGTLLSESLAAQGLYKGSAKSPQDIAKEIDGINEAAVNAAVKKAASTSLSMAAVGNLSATPYLDEL